MFGFCDNAWRFKCYESSNFAANNKRETITPRWQPAWLCYCQALPIVTILLVGYSPRCSNQCWSVTHHGVVVLVGHEVCERDSLHEPERGAGHLRTEGVAQTRLGRRLQHLQNTHPAADQPERGHSTSHTAQTGLNEATVRHTPHRPV